MIRKWLKRLVLAFVLGIVVLALSGAVYQAFGQWRDQERFHAPGRLLSVDGGGSQRRIHLDCRGPANATPVVVIETGLGAPAGQWVQVVESTARFARVCVSDRAGYGYSDPAPAADTRTTLEIVGDLEKLLAASGERPPYLLVGHSFGGFNIRVFAARHRDRIAGLLFVDSSHPEQNQRMPERVARQQRMLTRALVLLPLANRLGVLRAANTFATFAPDNSPGAAARRAEVTYLQSQPKFITAMRAELAGFDESARQVTAAGNSFGDLPLLVLTAGKDGINPPDLRKLWLEQLQPELVRLSSKGRQRVVANSTHLMNVDAPEAIVEGIREMVEAQKAAPPPL